jgi:hypothetical protein
MPLLLCNFQATFLRPMQDQLKYNEVKTATIMPHFKDDDNITNDEARMREGSNIHHENIVLMVDGKDTTLDVEFAALKAALPDFTSEEGATQGFEDNKEANLTDVQDTTLADLHCQTSILSSAIRHIRYLELRSPTQPPL